MRIGIPKEIKDHEFRVGVTPAGVRTLTDAGHSVRVEAGAGAAIGFDDAAYRAVGADIATHAAAVYDAELIVKVKEPQPSEFPLLRAEHTLFCYLHLAADATLTRHLLEQEVTGVAYETVAGADGGLPLLTPMSEVAGRIAIQAGAAALQMVNGGNGALLGGVPGVLPGKVVILGAGTVGRQSARMAMGLGADVVLLDINLERLRALDDLFAPPLKTCYS
ncbi:MAG TPA: alanine dehydrogenase, partial [Betaproteobacteria bacterium]|nr:alanine dehydrogenase [Betaproteobacteria bacterium]